MVYRTKLPDMASVANSWGDARLFAPSAERNSVPVVKTIQRIAPKSGQALEIASGTGQHIVKLASPLPNGPNHVWAVDFVHDKLSNNRP